MTDSSRQQGGLICVGAGVVALLFVIGVLRGSYLALAIPVTIVTLFALGLVFWVGWTIYTVQVEPERDEPPPSTVPPSPPSPPSSSPPNSSTPRSSS
jgi:hypothetical protein